jgi:hypothetical protein
MCRTCPRGCSPEALNDVAEFFELLANAEFMRHKAQYLCGELSSILRCFGSGRPTGRARVIHNLARPIFLQIAELADDPGGAERLTVVSPFDDGGLAVNKFCSQLGLDRVQIHAHPAGIVRGSFGSNWPKTVGAVIEPVEVEALSQEPRSLHAKMFEVVCRSGRIILSGSANSTMAGLDHRRSVELCVARIDRNPATPWHCVQRPVQQNFVIPRCVRDKMMQRLRHAPNIVRGKARRHGLHALPFPRRQQPSAVCLE